MTDPSPAGDTPERSIDVVLAITVRVTGPFLTDGLRVAERVALEALGFPVGFPIPPAPIHLDPVEAHGIEWDATVRQGTPLASWPTHTGNLPGWTRGGT